MSVFVDSMAYLVLLADIFLVGYTTSYLVRRYTDLKVPGFDTAHSWIYENRYYIILIVSGIATGGSLYLSNIMGWEPCRLCWFQRILMYPIFLLTGWGLILEKKDIEDYILPLAVLGAGTAIYHYGIQRVEQFSSAGCSITAISCSTEYTFHFGYITIPMMALTGFLVILAVMQLKKV